VPIHLSEEYSKKSSCEGCMMPVNRVRGSASILEYTLVLPLCLVAVGVIFFMGCFLCHYAILDAAADRTVLVIQSAYENGNYLAIADLGLLGTDGLDYVGVKERRSLSGLKDCELYRFLGSGDGYDIARELAVEKARGILEQAGLLNVVDVMVGQPNVRIWVERSGLSRRAHVEITRSIGIPNILGFSFWENIVTIKASAVATLLSPAEMVRNTDYILHLAERYTGIDISSKLSGVVSKAMNFFDR
jgi:hypothetical protein